MDNHNGKFVIQYSIVKTLNEQNTNDVVKRLMKNAQDTSIDMGSYVNDNATEPKLSFSHIKLPDIVPQIKINIVNNIVDQFEKVDQQLLLSMLLTAKVKNEKLFEIPYDQVVEIGTRMNSSNIDDNTYNLLRYAILNTLHTSFTNDTLNDCVVNVVYQQKMEITDLNDGSLPLGLMDQSKAEKLLYKYIQSTKIIDKLVYKILDDLNISIVDNDVAIRTINKSQSTSIIPIFFLVSVIFLCLMIFSLFSVIRNIQ